MVVGDFRASALSPAALEKILLYFSPIEVFATTEKSSSWCKYLPPKSTFTRNIIKVRKDYVYFVSDYGLTTDKGQPPFSSFMPVFATTYRHGQLHSGSLIHLSIVFQMQSPMRLRLIGFKVSAPLDCELVSILAQMQDKVPKATVKFYWLG